jgi:Planctomycete cytochrome C
MKKILIITTCIVLLVTVINACKHEALPLVVDPTPISGPVANNGVCFETEILPLMQSNCAKSGCHDAITHEKNLVLDSYANILKRDIVPGNADNSKIYKVLFRTGSDRMPPPPNADLTAAQKALIGKWINEGAKNTVNCNTSCDSTQFKYGANISILIGANCTGCHSGAAPSGNIDLSNYNTVKVQAANGKLVGSVTHAVGFSPMPQGTGKLSDCQITQIKKWVAAGALNN